MGNNNNQKKQKEFERCCEPPLLFLLSSWQPAQAPEDSILMGQGKMVIPNAKMGGLMKMETAATLRMLCQEVLAAEDCREILLTKARMANSSSLLKVTMYMADSGFEEIRMSYPL